MAPVIHVIDPNADTIIILKKPCTSFAQWDPVKVEPKLSVWKSSVIGDDGWGSVSNGLSKKEKKKAKSRKAALMAPPDPTPLNDVASADDQEVAPSAGASLFGNGVDVNTEGPLTSHTDTATETNTTPSVEPVEIPVAMPEPEEEEIHYHVSSRHLMLASPWFNRALTKDGWNESGRDQTDRRFHVAAEDWDPEAFLILFRIFHLRNRQVARTVTLEVLAKIAVLVDYYECAEATELFADVWIDNLKKVTFPSTYCRDLVLWIWVSSVFNSTDLFRKATATAIKTSPESLRTIGLPITTKVSTTYEINLERHAAIEELIKGLHNLLDKYRSVDYSCPSNSAHSFSCGSILLGALTREMDRLSLLMPRPRAPFLNLSFDDVCEKILTIKSPEWYIHGSSSHYGHGRHSCTLDEAINAVVSRAGETVAGVNISQSKKSKKSKKEKISEMQRFR
ncbi:hypothetical protein BKA66DRAFT_552777 [Pyrenochaeta sp. MPI-SDFR-AT-0127]|nr:hypothetical protein BKA66DRAFT_552777 [Pyrenochaeta sp. MPI-SDFR-AT-0127]